MQRQHFVYNSLIPRKIQRTAAPFRKNRISNVLYGRSLLTVWWKFLRWHSSWHPSFGVLNQLGRVYTACSTQWMLQFENQGKHGRWKSILCWHSSKTRSPANKLLLIIKAYLSINFKSTRIPPSIIFKSNRFLPSINFKSKCTQHEFQIKAWILEF